nr:immunoglobulin heavy chain junction region [Mus musculus]MBK4196034.1 immunoglobulin heavy chain junction region [Mus musculus]
CARRGHSNPAWFAYW